MKKYLTIILLLPLLASCRLDDAQYVPIRELSYAYVTEDGHLKLDNGTMAAPAEGGSVSVRILSNGNVTVMPPEGGIPDWMRLEGDLSFTGDGVITAHMELNEGFRRGAAFVAAMEGADSVTVIIRQNGVTPHLLCESPYKAVKGSSESETAYEIETNIPEADISCTVVYPDTEEWVHSVALRDGALSATAGANAGPHSRKAHIILSYLDGWNVEHSQTLYLTQASSADSFGTPVSFQELRAIAGAEPIAPDSDLTLKGIVVSDYRSPNMEANPVLSLDEAGDFSNTNVSTSTRESIMQVVDTTASARTAYLESPDGAYGIRLVYDKADDNVLSFGTALTLSLEGTTLMKESQPERYTLYGVRASSMIESEPGHNVPLKEKTIAALADQDLYTFVTLVNVEFPVKEGSFTDIRENHALWSEVNDKSVSATDTKRYFYMDGYAATLMDQEGKMICAPVNMLCRWRKPEDGIPQGAGKAKGVLVHNEMPRYGDAGKYQLRVLDQTGFEDLTEASGWQTIAGWDLGKTSASYGSGNITCTKEGAVMADEHSYKSRVAATKRTCGISDVFRSLRVNSPISGWYQWNEDGSVKNYNGLCMNISTQGIEGSQLSVAFRFYAGRSGTASTFQAFPAHWCVDYSLDGGESWENAANAINSGKPYVHLRSIATYTLQYGSYKIPTPTRAGLGASEHIFTLPAQVLGKDQLLIRIRPYDTVLSGIPTLYDGETETSEVTSTMSVQDYVSFQDIFIRYR